MITKIYKSILFKQTALLIAAAVLFCSFKSIGNGEVVLNAGTNVELETISMIQSDMVNVGQTIDFRVKYDVKVGDKTVITAGTIAKGQVMRAARAKGLGKEGMVEIQLKSVTATDGQQIFLSGGNVYQEGQDRQTLTIVLGVFVCLLLLMIKGKNAQIPPGFQITSSVASTVTVKI